MLKRWQADFVLLIITLLWGSTFVMVKEATSAYPIFSFLALRFGLALAALLTAFIRPAERARLRLGREALLAGAVTGLLLFAGYALQTWGLHYTSSGRAGFITGLNVVIVPALGVLFLRARPTMANLFGMVIAMIGLTALFWHPEPGVVQGDALVLGCAFAFAGHVIAIAYFGRRVPALVLATLQVGVVFVLCSVAALAFEPALSRPPTGMVWSAAAFTGVVVTAGVLVAQTSAQRVTTPAHTAVIFAMEPVFAALFGWLLAGEHLGVRAGLACAVMLFGLVASETGSLAPAKLRTGER
ncbi:MAG TPA: DMT family transporter [Limnochordia bacterium]|nr:DMT family transporter [Limnochordia bacterium]